MTESEHDDPIEAIVREFAARLGAGESLDPEQYARAKSKGDDGLRTRILSRIGTSTPGGDTLVDPDPGRTVPLTAAFDADPSAGLRIDSRYVVERQLGEGGFGVVYLVRDEVYRGNLRALKTLHGELAKDADLAQRFRNEIITVKAISHRYVPRFHNDGRTAEGDLYYVMDFVDGVRLDDVLKKEGPLKPDRIVQLIRQILEVLDFAHHKGVFHRDLKPANIILVNAGTPEEEVRVLDFGIAKITSREGEFSEMESMHTMQGGAMGTPHYMAPEQVTGQGKVDGKTDLYALGIIIYQMCSGRVPFTGKTSMEVAAARLTQAPPPLDEDTPEWLRLLVMRLLERQKEKRPDTVELRTELEHLAHGQRDLRRMLTWIGAGILVISLGVASLLWDRGRDSREESGVDHTVLNPGAPTHTNTKLDRGAPPRIGTPVTFRSPADGVRLAKADVEVAVDAPGRQRVKIGDSDVDVGADGIARRTVRVATDQSVSIVVRDEDGAELASRTVFVDTRAPVLTVDVPEGVVVSSQRWLTSRSELTIRGRIDDGEGGALGTDPVSIEGAREVVVGPDGAFSATIATAAGSSDLVVRGVDSVGNQANSRSALLVDLDEPVISFATRTAKTTEDRLRIEGSVRDSTRCSATLRHVSGVEPEETLVLDGQGHFSREVALALGENQISVEARDEVGHVHVESISVERVRAAAELTSIEPGTGRQVDAKLVTIRVLIQSNIALSRAAVSRTGRALEVELAQENGGYAFDLPLEFGANVFQVTPYDADGQPGKTTELTYVRATSGVPAGCTLPTGVEFDSSGRPLRVVHDRSGLELVLVPGAMRNGARIEDCYVGRTELTIGELERLRSGFYAQSESRPDYWDEIASDRARHPAVKVSFADARTLCRDFGMRLPTVEEWELAAGAGDGRAYPWGADWSSGACNADDAGDRWSRTSPVGSFPVDITPSGALDMGGNVSEWCTSGPDQKPALRGGNWFSSPEACRIAAPRNPPAKDSPTVGLRVALDARTAPR